MKTIHLFLAFFVAATTWADSDIPYVFFANVSGSLVPLSGMLLDEPRGNVSMFTYGDPMAKPVEFNLRYHSAYTQRETGRQFAGVYKNDFAFGDLVYPQSLDLDVDSKVCTGQFYACKMIRDPHRRILHLNTGKGVDYCEEVEIFILPYNRETKSAVLTTTDSAG